jgi:hypothetical protein
VFHKENSIQLECVSKAYIKDSMYLNRNTKFLPDRWALKTPPDSQSSLNEIVFRGFSQSGFFKNWLKLAMRFFLKSERIFQFVFYWLEYDDNNQIRIFLFVLYWLEYDQIVITIKFVHFWKKNA